MMWAELHPASLMAVLDATCGPAERSVARRWPPPWLPTDTAAARNAADRGHLARLDDRLLDDVGLTRASVERGLPFRERTAVLSPTPRTRKTHP